MPKVLDTRKQKSVELLKRLATGPYSVGTETDRTISSADYNLWVSTWVLDQLCELVPELREHPLRSEIHYSGSAPQTFILK